MRLTTIDSHFVCRIINDEYNYIYRDWFHGHYEKYSFRFCIEYFEKKPRKVDQIKNNDCKIITEPLDLKKYLQNWIFFFSEKMPQTKELYVQELIKVGNELIELKINCFICETHKPLFISWYLYKLAKIKK